MTKEQEIKNWLDRPMSHSQFNTWEWSVETWYNKYIKNIHEPETAELRFGKAFAKSIEDGTCEVKELVTKLPGQKEYPFNVVFNGIKLVGYADDFCSKTFKQLNEVKTGRNAWTQKKVDNHDQLTMYCLMNYITNKIKPEDVSITLYWLPTKETGDFEIEFIKPIKVYPFKTKRTMSDILRYGQYIKATRQKMLEYAVNHA